MITVLQRQHVQKRAVPPIRLRARTTGVRWRREEISRPVGASFHAQPVRAGVHGSIFERPRARLERRPRKIRPRPSARESLVARLQKGRKERIGRRGPHRAQRPERTPPATRRGVAALIGKTVRSGWVLVALGLALLALLFAPMIRGADILLVRARPALPPSGGLDGALYRVVVPEEPPRSATGSAPAALTGLKLTSYRTRAGDSLSQIAQRSRLSLGTLISWNGIRDARTLPIGTLLELPNADGLKYRVRRGDTLEGIARSSGVPLTDILDWNNLASSVIAVGQELFLPGARMSQNDLSRVTGNLFLYPVRGRLSSTFGSRPDPFTGVVRFHNGVDIVGRQGTTVGAAMAGSVAAIGFNANYGRYVFLQHSGYQTMYAHLNRIAVSTGQKLAQGQKIGELGNTGYSTGPHLHFSIYRGSEPVDPLRFLK
jgi:murein DD-endopeptidase MepM/ murein hydrolase activator NlpD